MKIVIDTNVLVSSLKSRRGASYKLISILPNQNIVPVLSVPLVVEYEAVLKRADLITEISHKDIETFIDYLCNLSEFQDIYFLWRPFLADPFDDHILEVAVASGSDAIITYNKRDFRGIEKFGLELLDPKEILIEIGELS
ncbi:MAG: putative toxin-antitoxin system toxin component, PIN family [Proteobacteria bacterium]|nr:putative toxin-antitoxin system toxin component, PIN family [Pseudomonadota bacterium]